MNHAPLVPHVTQIYEIHPVRLETPNRRGLVDRQSLQIDINPTLTKWTEKDLSISKMSPGAAGTRRVVT